MSSTDITVIKRGLASQAQRVAELLLPNGKKDGSEWRCGSINGEPGESFAVHLRGEKAGIWTDFAGDGEWGDLIDLWSKTRGIKLAQAIEEARKWLGMAKPERFEIGERKQYKRPAKPKCSVPKAAAFNYLVVERYLSEQAISAYKVAEQGDSIIFPFLSPEGELVMGKKRKAEDGAVPIPISSDFEHILFGWQAVPDETREITLVEGEIDALSMYDYGRPAMSVPMGGGGGKKQQWIENEYDRMDRFERIYLALDNDKVGDEACAEIALRLGRHRCLRVTLPRKDANECIKDAVTREEIDAAFSSATSLDPDGLRRPNDYADAVVRLFWPEAEDHVGYHLPYHRLRDKLHFRPAELTLWSGASGSGKSQLLSDSIVDFVKQGARVCLSSLEMKGSQTLKRMVKQAGGVDRPTAEYIHKTIGWLQAGLIMYERVGKCSVEGLIDVFDYARAKYGCDTFIIDSLMRLGIDSDDFSGQDKAVYALVDWAIQSNVHLHLVAHSRKSAMNSAVPETEDVKGSMEIGANAFNILTVWRDRARERELEEFFRLEPDVEKRKEKVAEEPGVVLNVAKQRNGDYEGRCGLWFDKTTYRYRSAECGKRRNYLTEIEGNAK